MSAKSEAAGVASKFMDRAIKKREKEWKEGDASNPPPLGLLMTDVAELMAREIVRLQRKIHKLENPPVPERPWK